MKTLLIDSDLETLGTLSLSLNFTFPDLKVIVAAEGAEGMTKALDGSPDLIVTETDLPDTDGFEVVKGLRLFTDVAIILISQKRNTEADIVKGLEMGADAYIAKPLRALDFMARTRAVMRRTGYYLDSTAVSPFVSENLHANFWTREITVRGQPVHLTPTEYRLLFQFLRNAGKIVTIQSLRQLAWGDADYLEPSAVRKCVSQLRRKLGDDPAKPQIILNERGMGYKFAEGRIR